MSNGGNGRQYAIEIEVRWDPLKNAHTGWALPLRLTGTWTQAEFTATSSRVDNRSVLNGRTYH